MMGTGSHEDYDVTIALLTRDAGAVLGRLLEAVFAQETGRRVEVLAVDSGSSDGTLEILQKYPVRMCTIPKGEFNWGRTREYAYEQSRGRVVINLSQDAVPGDADWLEHLVRPLDDPSVAVSCGSSVPDPERAFAQFPWERNGYFYFTREIGRFVSRYGKGLSFANSAVRRAVWEHLHFDEQPTGEDFQFQRKLYAAGLAIAFPDDAPVLHHHNYSLGGLWRRCRNEGYALKLLGCAYSEADLALDLLSGRKYVQWLRELKRGSLRTAADVSFPVLRPLAVYMGSRFTRGPIWY
ncbi:MAG: glycosyltransferase [Nitrospiraceae bacterium]|nr:glycosyltransferase [Nitrospiraceae bacterium]